MGKLVDRTYMKYMKLGVTKKMYKINQHMIVLTKRNTKCFEY